MEKFRTLVISILSIALGACSATPTRIETDAKGEAVVLAETSDVNVLQEIETIDGLRRDRQLAESRTAALAALDKYPANAEILWRASRAESDAVYIFHDSEPAVRDEAAAKALQLAKDALATGANSLEARAQYAWAMGNATHLQPMFARSRHARATNKVIMEVLDENIEQPTALATAALLQYRLTTLPIMVKLMAFSAPSADLSRAERYARSAHEIEPSRLHALILAKIEIAREKPKAAADVLRNALDAPEKFPRDAEVTPELKELLLKCAE